MIRPRDVDANPRAFPLRGVDNHGFYTPDQPGMDLRDWLAGQALCSIPLRNWDVEGKGDEAVIKAWAKCAYQVADAMLEERSRS